MWGCAGECRGSTTPTSTTAGARCGRGRIATTPSASSAGRRLTTAQGRAGRTPSQKRQMRLRAS
eukprot:11045915-Lingulodinium_polyedra.AAC.1